MFRNSSKNVVRDIRIRKKVISRVVTQYTAGVQNTYRLIHSWTKNNTHETIHSSLAVQTKNQSHAHFPTTMTIYEKQNQRRYST